MAQSRMIVEQSMKAANRSRLRGAEHGVVSFGRECGPPDLPQNLGRHGDSLSQCYNFSFLVKPSQPR